MYSVITQNGNDADYLTRLLVDTEADLDTTPKRKISPGSTAYVIETKKHIEELEKVGKWDWFTEAPYIIAVVAKPSDAWTRYDGKNLGDIDATIVMDHIILEATELGLGTCFIAAYNREAVIEMLKLSDDYEPVLLTPLGYPDAEPRGTDRKSLDELVEFI